MTSALLRELGHRSRGGTSARGRGARRGRRRAWLVFAWTRLLALCVLLFAAPGASDLVRETIAELASADCCADGCDDCRKHGCASGCSHCACCSHPSAVPAGTQLALATPPALFVGYPFSLERASAGGYRAPPFRPPLG